MTQPATTPSQTARLQVYDPAMCCSTGVCGPAVDPVLPRFSADLAWLAEQGVQVERFNLAQQIDAFAASTVVKAALVARDTACLPLLLVDGQIVAEGTYPDRDTLARLTGLAPATITPAVQPVKASCCGPKGCC